MFVNRYQIISILLLLFVGLFLFFDWSGEIKQVIIGEKTFFVEVARTKMELERGLSLHIPLLDNQGMLFVFPKEDIHRFWMKDMSFSIDIVWIDSKLKIVGIEKNISPDTYPKTFSPETKSRYVLEIPAGQADFLSLKVGQSVEFIKK